MATADLIGSSMKFRALVANMVVPVDSAVLIQGETGTDKEMIAARLEGRLGGKNADRAGTA